MCLEALPQLLEDEEHRTTAQRADLSDVVFRAMLAYPESANLHSAAFHTLVLLGRPLGGQEGMIIDLMDRRVLHGLSVGTATFLDLETSGRNRPERRIPIVLDSMRRFEQDERLQTRACWALVNLALVPSQKKVIIHNGGIETTLRAMQNSMLNCWHKCLLPCMVRRKATWDTSTSEKIKNLQQARVENPKTVVRNKELRREGQSNATHSFNIRLIWSNKDWILCTNTFPNSWKSL
jgi:hypothetical protein